MKLLLDTHALLWFEAGDPQLGLKAREVLEDADTEVYLSSASIWEMAIKSSRGHLKLPDPLNVYMARCMTLGVRLMPVLWSHAAAVEGLPFHHNDPFDRMLIAQAFAEDMPVATRDVVFRKYGVQVIW